MSEIITLQQLCRELKISPPQARKALRAAVEDGKHAELAKAHEPKSAWKWAKGGAAEKEARAVLAEATK